MPNSKLSLLVLVLLSFYFNSFATPARDTVCASCPVGLSTLHQALDLMQKKYYRNENINWEELRKNADDKMAGAGEDAGSVLQWCFSQIKENHSFLMSPQQARTYTKHGDEPIVREQLEKSVGPFHAELLEGQIGYIAVPWIKTTDSVLCSLIADSLQGLLQSLDSHHISKWIVDLRSNSGGNCWPMLAGIGPLLGNGTHGYFICRERWLPIQYNNGRAMNGKHCICRVNREAYIPSEACRQVAVLIGPGTSSAGEIIALAFKGYEDAKFFGQPTAGFTTGNTTFNLDDGSMLVLSVASEADRFGKTCNGKILPDEEVTASSHAGGVDATLKAAVNWLHPIY